MKRCDVAQIKILTNEKSAIDSSLAVKVLGCRFDIRVMEELGGDQLTTMGFAKGNKV
jgi:hypothetical protein